MPMRKITPPPVFAPLFDAPTRTALATYLDGAPKIVFSVMRNEAKLVRAWVAHYRDMGIGKIVVVDNASTDGTPELLRKLGAFTVSTSQSYSSSNFGMRWTSEFLQEIQDDTIVINVDADELLIYDGWPGTDIDSYLKDFEASKSDTIFAFLMDMYPDGPLDVVSNATDHDLFSAAPLHDSDYVFRLRPRRPWHRHGKSIEILGGPRARMLSSLQHQQRSTWLRYLVQGQIDRFIHFVPKSMVPLVVKLFPKQMPELSKYPVFKVRKRAFVNAHVKTGANIHYRNVVLCHFKFVPGIAEKCQTEMQRAEHYRRGAEYILYSHGLHRLKNGDLRYPGSTRFCPSRLAETRIIRDLSEFI